MTRLQEKVTIITGEASGIGLEGRFSIASPKNLIRSVPQKMFQRYFFRQLVWLDEDIVL